MCRGRQGGAGLLLSALVCLGLTFPKGFGDDKDRNELCIVCSHMGQGVYCYERPLYCKV